MENIGGGAAVTCAREPCLSLLDPVWSWRAMLADRERKKIAYGENA